METNTPQGICSPGRGDIVALLPSPRPHNFEANASQGICSQELGNIIHCQWRCAATLSPWSRADDLLRHMGLGSERSGTKWHIRKDRKASRIFLKLPPVSMAGFREFQSPVRTELNRVCNGVAVTLTP
jgi:hypothetical protein